MDHSSERQPGKPSRVKDSRIAVSPRSHRTAPQASGNIPAEVGRSRARLLLLAAISLSAMAPQAAEEAPETARAQRLVDDLGHELWLRRQAAEEEILRQAAPPLDILRKASTSADPELAERARYLLSKLDPLGVSFTVLRIAAGPEASVIEAHHGTCPQGAEARLTSGVVGAMASGAPTYAATWTHTDGGGIAVEVRESRRGGPATSLRVPPGSIPAVSLLKLSDEVCYEPSAPRRGRQHRRILTLLEQRAGGEAASAERAWTEVRAALLDQARATDPTLRRAALEVLVLIAAEEARELFAAAVDDDVTMAVGALGLGELGDERAPPLLHGLVEGTSPGAAGPGLQDRSEENGEVWRLRAASLLAGAGDPIGGRFLLHRLVAGDSTPGFTVLAALNDHFETLAAHPVVRREVIDAVLSAESLSKAPWSQFAAETEHLVQRTIDLLRPEDPNDVRAARGAIEALEDLAAGAYHPVRMRLSFAFALWTRVAQVAPEALGGAERTGVDADLELESRFLARLLPRVQGTESLNEAIGWCLRVQRGRPLPAEVFGALADVIGNHLDHPEPQISTLARSKALEVSSSLTLGEGQLRPWVSLLIRAAERRVEPDARNAGDRTAPPEPKRAVSLHQLLNELNRWSGALPPALDSVRAQNDDPLRPWKEWILDSATVAAREAEVTRKQEDTRRAAKEYLWHEFDLILPEGDAGSTPLPREGPKAPQRVQVVDGREVRLRLDEGTLYRDRWGNRRQFLIESQPPAKPGGPLRVRIEGQGLTVGVPALLSIRTREANTQCYEASDLDPSMSIASRPPAAQVLTLALVSESARAETGTSSETSQDGGVGALWRRFLDQHLFAMSETAPREQLAPFLALLRRLRLEESTSFLRRVLQATRDPEIARDLDALGDPAGREFLLAELQSDTVTKRLAAARTLCDLGEPAAVEALVKLVAENEPLLRSHAATVFPSLERFLALSPQSSAPRRLIGDFVFPRLDQPLTQHWGFRVAARLAGTDFGYAAAVQQRAAKAGAAQELLRKAVQAAKAWWLEHR
jgi:HEAT repeat protein